MFIEISHNIDNELKTNTKNTMKLVTSKKPSYSIKKLLKQLFKARHFKSATVDSKHSSPQKKNSIESLESIDNKLNADIEKHCSIESIENEINERISISCELENCDFADLNTVPVHFVRTEHGTFFWTAISAIPADHDLIEPLNCSTWNQIAVATPFKDRWAQA